VEAENDEDENAFSFARMGGEDMPEGGECYYGETLLTLLV
jgi:hypothetical protein